MSFNLYNQFFYSKVKSAYTRSGLADFFTKIEPIQFAIEKFIKKSFTKNQIRVKELGSGTDLTRWKTISKMLTDQNWYVTLTDFNKNSLPDIISLKHIKSFDFKVETLNLLKPFTNLNIKYDVFLATYVFDSIWFDQDAHYEKYGNKWYKTHYTLEATKHFKAKESLQITEFEKIKIKRNIRPIDIRKESYGELISDYYKDVDKLKLNFPGGLIDKVKEAFTNQIAKGGMFIIGDMAVNNKKGFIPAESKNEKSFFMDDYHTSGRVAKFKIEDYGLAKLILEKEGFKVNLETVEDFIKNSGYEIPLKVRDHWIMIIKNQ